MAMAIGRMPRKGDAVSLVASCELLGARCVWGVQSTHQQYLDLPATLPVCTSRPSPQQTSMASRDPYESGSGPPGGASRAPLPSAQLTLELHSVQPDRPVRVPVPTEADDGDGAAPDVPPAHHARVVPGLHGSPIGARRALLVDVGGDEGQAAHHRVDEQEQDLQQQRGGVYPWPSLPLILGDETLDERT
eukprot:scaffold13603_cov112-Isochrysis_galbana.AAC.5